MEGFLPGSRATFMLDLVAVAMFAVLPMLAFGIRLVRVDRNYIVHKSAMSTIAIVLAVAVILFEIEMRVVGWRHLAEISPYFQTTLFPVLSVHLLFSVSTTILLTLTVFLAWRRFPTPPRPTQHSTHHKILGRLSAIGLTLTSVTGWIFYYMAFIAV
jgi:putative membrane protein